jgi:hypothetical protein
MTQTRQWFIGRDGKQYGPISDAELEMLIELGHLQASDLLWHAGFPDWRSALAVFPTRKLTVRPVWPEGLTYFGERLAPFTRDQPRQATPRRWGTGKILIICLCVILVGAASAYVHHHRAGIF